MAAMKAMMAMKAMRAVKAKEKAAAAPKPKPKAKARAKPKAKAKPKAWAHGEPNEIPDITMGDLMHANGFRCEDRTCACAWKAPESWHCGRDAALLRAGFWSASLAYVVAELRARNVGSQPWSVSSATQTVTASVRTSGP
jgi:hypothetical protein